MRNLYRNHKIAYLFYMAFLTFFVSFSFGIKLGDVKTNTKLYTNPVKQWIVKYKSSFANDATNDLLILFLIGIVLFFLVRRAYSKRAKRCSLFVALCSSGLLLLGRAYFKRNDLSLLFESRFAFSKAVFIFIGNAIIIYFMVVAFIEYVLPRIGKSEWIKNYVPRRFKITVRNCFLAMVIAWIPYVIITYPCNFTPDAREEVAQFTNDSKHSKTMKSVIYKEGSKTILNNHHPIVYTILVGGTAKIGMLAGNINVAMFLFALAQMCLLAWIYSYLVTFLRKLGVPPVFQMLTLGFFMFYPIIPMYALTITKDSIYGGFMILVTIGIVKIVIEEESIFASRREKWMLFGSFLGLMLFRNNGLYIAIVVLIVFGIRYRKEFRKLKSILFMIGIPIVLYGVVLLGIILPLAGIPKGSPREMMSIPFQQVARYAVEWGEEGFEEGEIEILDKVLSFDGDLEVLKERYDPLLSDPVKNHYNKYCTKQELKEFFIVWGKLFFRHPATCISATLNNNVYYYSIDYGKHITYNGVPEKPNYYGLENPKATTPVRKAVVELLKALGKSSMLGWAFKVGTWTYVFGFCVVYVLYKKCYRYLYVVLPVVLNFLIGIAGPVAYMRYAVEWIVVFPIFGAVVWRCVKEKFVLLS